MMTEDLTLEDLATHSGLPLRTLRYYIQEGILQGPDTRGKYASYSQQHLDRLELIQRLKKLRLPLQEIRHLLENMSPEEVSTVRQYQDILKHQLNQPVRLDRSEFSSSQPKSSALEYIRSLEQDRENLRALTSNIESSTSTPPAAARPESTQQKFNFLSDAGQENWTRIVLRDGIELNVRTPMGTDEKARVARLIEFARNLFHDQARREK